MPGSGAAVRECNRFQRRPSRTLSLCLLFAILGNLTGCSSDSQHGTVTGSVTLDGQPLEVGVIRFTPANGQAAAVEANISAGQFTARVPVGQSRVMVTSPKVVGKRKAYQTADSPTVDVVEERLPARYNAKSELSFDVTPGEQSKDFPLQSGN